MDRSEQAGVGVALIGHGALFAVLSLGILTQPRIKPPLPPAVDVELIGEVALEAEAPAAAPATSAAQAPAAAVEPFDALPEAAPPRPVPPPPPALAPRPPAPVEPAQQAPVSAARKGLRPVNPEPAPSKPSEPKRAAPRPTQTAAADPRDRRRPDRSIGSLVAGYRTAPGAAAPAAPSAARPAAGKPAIAKPGAAPASASSGRTVAASSSARMSTIQKTSLFAVINSQLRPHWKPPSGADAELLVTRLSVRLNPDGSLAAAPEIEGQDGVTDSNRAQAALHAQRAIDAVRRAAPFQNLPPEFYESWKWLKPLRFDGKLAR